MPSAKPKRPRIDRTRVAGVVDNNRARGLALIASFKQHEARVIDDFYEMGKLLSELSEPRIYTALGHKSFHALLRKHRLLARITAHKLISVANTYTRREAHALGLEKAYALSRFVAATPEDDLARTLFRLNAKIAGRPLSDLSARQLKQATKDLRRATGQKPRKKSEAETQANRTARELQRRLRDRGAKDARVRAVRRGAKFRLQIEVDVEDAGVV